MEKPEEMRAAEECPRLPRSYAECWEYVRSDYYRYTGRRASLPAMLYYAWRHPVFGFSLWLRLSARRGWAYLLCRLMHRRYVRRYGLQIYPTTRIGYGLYIGHAFGIIVNPTAVIGDNVNLSQLTTIGSNKGRAAVIGPGVYIGAGATIGAGAVVTRDVPPDTTAAGVPARVVSPHGHPEFIGNRWPARGYMRKYSQRRRKSFHA